MRAFGLVLVALFLAACRASAPAPTPVLMTPQSRLIYHDTEGHGIWTQCDRGNRIYMTQGGQFQVVPGGCQNGEP